MSLGAEGQIHFYGGSWRAILIPLRRINTSLALSLWIKMLNLSNIFKECF